VTLCDESVKVLYNKLPRIMDMCNPAKAKTRTWLNGNKVKLAIKGFEPLVFHPEKCQCLRYALPLMWRDNPLSDALLAIFHLSKNQQIVAFKNQINFTSNVAPTPVN